MYGIMPDVAYDSWKEICGIMLGREYSAGRK
jgi:hypothetical protein